MRKVFAVLLCGVMLAVMGSVPALAEYWNEGRSGDSWEDAYVIASLQDLTDLRDRVNSGKENTGKYYVLTTDIDMSSQISWTGIGNNLNYNDAYSGRRGIFTGHFDGQNHTIRFNDKQGTGLHDGLFSYVSSYSSGGDAAIKNLNVTGRVTAQSRGCSIVSELISGIIENCSFTGRIYTYSSVNIAGGIVANLSGGTIRNCRVSADISGSTTQIGGIAGQAGYAGGRNGSIENCTVEALSVPYNAQKVGGIAGSVYEGFTGNISGNTWPSQYPENGDDYTPNTNPAVPDAPDSPTPAPGGDTPSTPGDTPSAPEAPVSSDVPASPKPDDTPSGNDDPYAAPVAPAPQNDDSNPASPEGQTTTSPLPRGTIQPITLAQSVLEKVARAVSTDISQIHTLTSSNISAPQEPTQDMRDYIKGDNAELTGKLNTLSVNQSGYYVFKVTLTDELFEQVKGQKVSGFKFYGLHDSEAQARASFITGFLNTLEVLTMTGDKLEAFGVKEFLMVGLLNSGTPFSVYLAKIILALLAGGCSSGIFAGGLAVIALSVLLKKH